MEQGIAVETLTLVENRRQRQRKAQSQLQARLEELQAENVRLRQWTPVHSCASANNYDIGGIPVWQFEQDHTNTVRFDISDGGEQARVHDNEDIQQRLLNLEYALFNAPVLSLVRVPCSNDWWYDHSYVDQHHDVAEQVLFCLAHDSKQDHATGGCGDVGAHVDHAKEKDDAHTTSESVVLDDVTLIMRRIKPILSCLRATLSRRGVAVR